MRSRIVSLYFPAALDNKTYVCYTVYPEAECFLQYQQSGEVGVAEKIDRISWMPSTEEEQLVAEK